MLMMKYNDPVVLITGGFDPLHLGHIEMIKSAANIGRVVIGVNSDEWLARKKKKPFMDIDNRKAILQHLKGVVEVIEFDDSDDSAIDAIHKTLTSWPNSDVIFANGGDRSVTNIPEASVRNDRLFFIDDVGGNKKLCSSSDLLARWQDDSVERSWGKWSVLRDLQPGLGVKVKELVIHIGMSLSHQRHNYRHEYWYVLSGTIEANIDGNITIYGSNDSFLIHKHSWHMVRNVGEVPARVIEIQYGEQCVEHDIERR